MPFDLSGNYSLPEAPFVANTQAQAGQVNSNFADIATALTACLRKALVSPFAFTLLDDADAAAMQATLGAEWRQLEPAQVALASASITFALPAGVNQFRLVLHSVIPTSAGATLRARVSQDGGATYLSGASDYNSGGASLGTGGITFGGAGAAIGLTEAMALGAADTARGSMEFTPGSTTEKAAFEAAVGFVANGTGDRRKVELFASVNPVVARCTHLRLDMSAGNIGGGRFILFGGV